LSLTWTQKLSIQLNLAHVARKIYKKKKLKQTNANPVQVKIREGSPDSRRNKCDYGGKDL